ncbi:ACP S-malonyltransferase [Streptomyces montanus]|uniref:Malonyl CoA-acyl carrier protein transacylase n=1 Tax=Streptomyces montanus TaxID=2580423 RepID=A0A5R9FZI6_9ACTN|nr:ACP S-malonyltransferase [Streptomyces montanus]TLS47340.1 ACP S-malonyltransferase [Streptomyces montanus]
MNSNSSADLVMFPGQGSQRAGMAGHLLERHPAARQVFTAADAALGIPLSALCTTGTAEELAATDITQPAILATSLATWQVLREAGCAPDAVAGHSLGEYAALVAAGVLKPESALRLVQVRGRLMAEVARQRPGAMAAVLGLAAEQVIQICDQAGQTGLVEVANFNEPLQTVLSGEAEAVEAAGRAALAAGAEKVVALKVGAPFHCSLMNAIEGEFAAELDAHTFADPVLPVISSVTGDYLRDGEHARELLRRQLSGPVRWVDVVRRAQQLPVETYTEVGPGRVLSGLVRRTDPDARVRSSGDERRLGSLVDVFAPAAPVPA